MDHIRFDAGEMTLIITCATGTPPSFAYWGQRLSGRIDANDIAALSVRQGADGNELESISPSLAMEAGIGFSGLSGFAAHREGRDWGSHFLVQKAHGTKNGAVIETYDSVADLALVYTIDCDSVSGLLHISSRLTNDAQQAITLDHMATACLPVPQSMTDIIGFSGRWSDEFARQRLARFSGGYLRENRRGRTSHDSFPGVILCEQTTTEQNGSAYGLHLAWSGNHHIRVDSLNDGRVFASMGALFFPGEITLGAGEYYDSPPIIAGYSGSGLSPLSRSFHRHVRENLLRSLVRDRPRPVHYNCWEAVYFDHDVDQLKQMADKAADIGIERFVLDDGWFGSRRSEKSGLGDWTVADSVYPGGLKPLIDHVTALGMEMGIWFEPEMVNPDSELYRMHPEWVLQIESVPQIPFRHQYVLDISRSEVSDYLFDQMDAILSEYDIGYVKWDMNRDLNHPGDMDGKARAHAHVLALYALMDRLRAAHPQVELESCASGGGRADMGILAHTDRIWTSDSNDALDRQNIQRGASYFLPLDVLGSHVGPGDCHITGRSLSMAMRGGTAIMGHMGVELNLLTEPAADIQELKSAIALYKMHRALLHTGDLERLDTPDYITAMGVIAPDKSEAIFSVSYQRGHETTLPAPIYFTGLDADMQYRLRLIWPHEWQSPTSPSVIDSLGLAQEGALCRGEALMTIGMQLPLAFPETTLLLHVEKA